VAQVPLQLTWPVGHSTPHVPAVHASPDGQARPQEPQLRGSMSVSTHDPEQSDRPEGQPPPLQEPPEQTWPGSQSLPQDPQLAKSEASETQTPPHPV
jgi:hypothetical protein